jgi:hypothetical protein
MNARFISIALRDVVACLVLVHHQEVQVRSTKSA